MAILKSKWFTRILFVIGFAICSYPLFSSMYERSMQNGAIQTYETAIQDISKKEMEKAYKDAVEYNDMLFQTQGAYIGSINDSILTEEHYNELLNTSNNGVMGSIEIPKINVNLPIYHGTEEKVLSNGVGHYEASSLPVGGNNTHCMLTGHRGLPNSKLFTRLDELEEKDLFYISVCGKTLAYQVFDIKVVEPEELELLTIHPDEDVVSLITCTPYGINTHRLVVTGQRIPYKKSIRTAIQPKMMSIRELIFTVLPFSVLLFVIIREFLKRRKEKKKC